MKTQQLNLNQISEVKLTYVSKVKSEMRPVVSSSHEAHRVLYSNWNMETIEHVEEFKIMLLNRANKVLGIASVSKGGTSGTVVDIRIILQYAIKSNASSIIAVHNHPSGNLKPSNSDIQLTKKIKEAAKLMDISLLDHLIITAEEKYFSMADDGIL